MLHPWYAEERLARAERAAAGNSIPGCRHFLRCGCPASARPRLWAAALGVEVGEREVRAISSKKIEEEKMKARRIKRENPTGRWASARCASSLRPLPPPRISAAALLAGERGEIGNGH